MSRDKGLGPIEPWGTQRALIHAIFDGLKRDMRQVLVLKAGQIGATLIMQLFSLFWMQRSPGLQGVCVADSDEVREFLRDNMTLMADPPDDEEKGPSTVFRRNDRNRMSFHNGSRLMFQTAGPRSGRRVGVGRGVAFIHATEVGLWTHPASLTYLRTRFSDQHPYRLAVYESTARGHNWWFDAWQEASDAVDIQRIFLSWWLREDYRLDPRSPEYARYWDGRLTDEEKRWQVALTRRYHRELTPMQWAWRRWYVQEKAAGDAQLANQEMPTLPEDSFEATGQSFLGYDLISRCRQTLKAAPKVKGYRYEFGQRLEDSKVVPTKAGLAHLLVWEEPKPAEAYVIAAVPSYAGTPTCSTGVVSVWRASLDTLEQVAEFADTNCGLQTFCWVCVHLLSVYKVQRRAFILEVAGAGMGVLQELKRLQATGWGTRLGPAVRKLVGPISSYIWTRPDSLAGGVALQWKSTGELQGWLLRRLKDQLGSGTVILRSAECVAECERMRQLDDHFESEGRTIEEHRLMAAALAVESWASQVRPLFRKVHGDAHTGAKTVMERMMTGFFSHLGAKPAATG